MMDDPANLHHRLRRRNLYLFMLVDVSGSMAPDGKMPSLNTAIEEALPHLRRVAIDAPAISVLTQVLTFGSSATWIDEPVPIESFTWDDLEAEAGGFTEVGQALHMLTNKLDELPIASVVPPAILLVSDGLPTDITPPTFAEAIDRLEAHPLGRSATRMAVGIGRDADLDTLRRFLGPHGSEPVRADSPQQLMVQVRDRISAAVQSASELTA